MSRQAKEETCNVIVSYIIPRVIMEDMGEKELLGKGRLAEGIRGSIEGKYNESKLYVGVKCHSCSFLYSSYMLINKNSVMKLRAC